MPNLVKYKNVDFPTMATILKVTDLTLTVKTVSGDKITIQASKMIDMKEGYFGDYLEISGKRYIITKNWTAFGDTMDVYIKPVYTGKTNVPVKYLPGCYADVAGERLATNGHYTGQHKGTPLQDAQVTGTQSANSVEAGTVRYGTIMGDAIDTNTFPKKA